jgi:hypothetical protein
MSDPAAAAPNPPILVVTRQFAMRWGGAEHSIAEVLEELTAARPGLHWNVTDCGFDPPGRLRPLPLLALYRDRRRLRDAAAAMRAPLMLAQSLLAPVLLNALPRALPAVWFLRDVAYWDQWPNNETGRRWWLKAGYRLVQRPLVAFFRAESQRALERADLLVANSGFMAERIRGRCGRNALVVFPRTPVAAAPLAAGEWVGMVGDGADKGGAILRALARRFPDVRFRVHSRAARLPDVPDNVIAAPWERDPERLYAGLRLMLVPSQVAEAYGRVAVEAQGHGVPALVSGIGGLPGNVPGPDWVVADFRSPAAWIEAFERTFATAAAARERVHGFARHRRAEADQQHRVLTERLLALLDCPPKSCHYP